MKNKLMLPPLTLLTVRLMNWLELPRIRRVMLSLFGIAVVLLIARSYYIVNQPLVSPEEFHRVTYRAVAMFPWLIGLGTYEEYGVGAKKIMYLYCLNYLPGLLLGVYFALIDIKNMKRIVEKAKHNRKTLWLRILYGSACLAIFFIWLPFNMGPMPVRNGLQSMLFLNSFTAPLASLIYPWVTGGIIVSLTVFWIHLLFLRSK